MKNLKFMISILLLLVFLTGCKAVVNKEPILAGNEKQIATQGVDKLEVYYFYRTQRCASCLIIGEYVNKTMSEYFLKQIESGKIDYQEVNIDLPENKELARKFEASGSSLFINAITGETENIENVMEVWRLSGNEAAFKNFLRQKINNLLGL